MIFCKNFNFAVYFARYIPFSINYMFIYCRYEIVDGVGLIYVICVWVLFHRVNNQINLLNRYLAQRLCSLTALLWRNHELWHISRFKVQIVDFVIYIGAILPIISKELLVFWCLVWFIFDKLSIYTIRIMQIIDKFKDSLIIIEWEFMITAPFISCHISSSRSERRLLLVKYFVI